MRAFLHRHSWVGTLLDIVVFLGTIIVTFTVSYFLEASFIEKVHYFFPLICNLFIPISFFYYFSFRADQSDQFDYWYQLFEGPLYGSIVILGSHATIGLFAKQGEYFTKQVLEPLWTLENEEIIKTILLEGVFILFWAILFGFTKWKKWKLPAFFHFATPVTDSETQNNRRFPRDKKSSKRKKKRKG